MANPGVPGNNAENDAQAGAGAGGTPPTADPDELLASIGEMQGEVDAKLQTVAEQIAIQEAKDRSRIAQIIVWLFALAIGATVLFVIGSALTGLVLIWTSPECNALESLTGACRSGIDAWKEAGAFLLDFLTSLVLPVVTLVIGFYFGTQKTDK